MRQATMSRWQALNRSLAAKAVEPAGFSRERIPELNFRKPVADAIFNVAVWWAKTVRRGPNSDIITVDGDRALSCVSEHKPEAVKPLVKRTRSALLVRA